MKYELFLVHPIFGAMTSVYDNLQHMGISPKALLPFKVANTK